MAASAKSGPAFNYGNLDAIQSALSGGFPVPDPNQDNGPGANYLPPAWLDHRMFFPKDKITGWTGQAWAHLPSTVMRSAEVIPTTLSASNIAPAAGVTSGVAMTLAAASLGITLNMPISPIISGIGAVNGQPVITAAIALDFGFGYANVVANTAAVTVPDSSIYDVGMPLVIGGCGNAGGTIPLLTQVASITSTTVIALNSSYLPLASNATAPVGTGNVWGPSEIGFPIPTAASPFMARGPGLFLDYRQGLTRGMQIVGASGGTGGTFTVAGWDIYGEPMTETITVAGGASTGWGKKAFKYIASVTPNFTDVSHNYTVGNSDMFGFAYRAGIWEDTSVFWAGAAMAATTGFTAPLAFTTPTSTSTTADVRGTIQVSGNGPLGSGIGASASNGTLSANVLSGRQLLMKCDLPILNTLRVSASNPQYLFGQTQA